MKARIVMDPASKSGNLQIIPESHTEAYALWSWWRKFNDTEDCMSTIQVLDLGEPPG